MWIIADTHFNHKNIIEYCHRPLDFEERIFKSLNKVLQDDILIHLGDVCVGQDEAVHEKLKHCLKCRRFLVKGNHDKKTNSWYLSHGWDFVCESFTDRYFGQKIMFSHKPKQLEKYVDLNIHGHLHEIDEGQKELKLGTVLTEKHKLFSLEKENYKPVLLDAFLRRDS